MLEKAQKSGMSHIRVTSNEFKASHVTSGEF